MTEQPQGQDDLLHPPGGAVHWRESLYFGFHDEKGQAGLTYLSLSPNQHVTVSMVILPVPGSAANLVYLQSTALPEFGGAALETGALQFRCREPLRRWHLHADVQCLYVPCSQEVSSALVAAVEPAASAPNRPVQFELEFLASMPAYRFPAGAFDFLGAGQQHLEQMGRVSGWLRLGKEEAPFSGLGGRDRSWGTRDWLRPEWYNWLNLQFGEDLFISVALSRVEGQESSSGFVYQAGLLQPVVHAVLQAQRDSEDLHLLSGQAHIVTQAGRTFELGFIPSSYFHTIVARQGAWQDHDCMTLVTCQWGEQRGQGLWEYAQREPVAPHAAGRTAVW